MPLHFHPSGNLPPTGASSWCLGFINFSLNSYTLAAQQSSYNVWLLHYFSTVKLNLCKMNDKLHREKVKQFSFE